jgi:hypothetical protein
MVTYASMCFQLGVIMNLKSLSWERPEGILIRAEYGRQPCRAMYQRTSGPITAAPDIAFEDDKVHFLTLRFAAAFPYKLLVQEQSGMVYRYVRVPDTNGTYF